MARRFQDVTNAELGVLQCLWEQPRRSVREIADALYGNHQPSRTSTVLKLLERLEKKGHVRRHTRGAVQTFSARMNRADLIEHRLQAVADALCQGSPLPLVMHLVDSRRLAPHEVAQLRSTLDGLAQEQAVEPASPSRENGRHA